MRRDAVASRFTLLSLLSLVPTALLTAPPAGAQETPADAHPADTAEVAVRLVTEEEFVRPVLADPAGHPAALALTGDLGAARARAIDVRTLENPVAAVAREDPSGGAEQFDLTVSWQPPRPGRHRLAVDAAEAEVTAAEARLAADRMTLHSTLRAVYADWALAAARLSAVERRTERIASLAERERLRAERGESSGLAARRLELAAVQAGAEAARRRAELARAGRAARAFRPDLEESAVPRPPDLPPPPPALEAAHPRIAALEAELEAARLQGEVAERHVDLPELMAGWQTIDTEGGSSTGPLVGLAWPIPLVDRNRAERARAQARATTAAARLELARREVAAELAGARAAYDELRSAALELDAAAAGTAPVVEAAEAAFRLGEAGLTDLLDTLRTATETELTALGLRADALAAHRDLERAAGRPLTEPEPEASTDRPTPSPNGGLR